MGSGGLTICCRELLPGLPRRVEDRDFIPRSISVSGGSFAPGFLLSGTGHAGHGVYLPRRAENPHGDLAGKCKRTGERVKRKGVPLSAATLHLENLSAATLPILKLGAVIEESQA